ncbi:MAG: Hydantoinase B/oxoprolinase, partial [Chloroflexi bacterium]|nr:Hydantoinase B/oxoprolinase [Chloroflexota bacterium]
RLSTDYLAYTGRLCRTLLGVVSSPATAEEEAVVVLPDGSLVRVRVAARLDDQTLSIDLGGSDNVTRAGSYPPLTATLGAVLFTVISGWAELLPLNDGAFSPITVSTRRGTVVNPPANAATTSGSELILPAVAQASSRVLGQLIKGHRSAMWPRLPKFAAYTPPPGSRVRLSSGQPLFPGALSEVAIPSAEELERDSGIRVLHRERREGSSTIDFALANLGPTARICAFEGDGTVRLPGGNTPAVGWGEWVAGQSIEMSYAGEELPHE